MGEKAKSGKPRVKKSNAEDDQRFALCAMRFALKSSLSVVSSPVVGSLVVRVLLLAAPCSLLTSDAPCAMRFALYGQLSVVLSSKL